MRTSCGVVMLVVALGIGCGGRTGTVATPTAGTPGAEAAARMTVQEYDALEERVGDRYPALERHLRARELNEAAQAAQELAVTFGEIERFWAQNGKPDAVKWAQDAATRAVQAAGAATAGDLATASRAAASMQAACKQCHGAYRELDSSGEFRIRPRALTRR